MLIDFTKIKSGQDFEDLCADLLEAEGFKVIRHSGVGPDRGMDIIAEKDVHYGVDNPERFIWLIQCKHKNKGSVGRSDLRDYIKDIPKHGADGYFLITDSHLATTVEDDLTNVDKSNDFRFKAKYWDMRSLENKLNQHQGILEKYGLGEPKKVAHEKRNWYEFNPYKLLDSYNENDKEYFFGRDEDVTELLELVYRHNIVVLFGESGTGKTSVLNAGLIPKQRDNNFLIAYVRCLDDPVTRLRKEVIGRLSALETKSKINLDGLSATKNMAEFIRELQTVLEQRDTKMVVVIDQFEEAFTRAGERDRLQLAEGITELTSTLMSKGRLVFLFSIREDYLGYLWDWASKNKIGEAWNNTYHLKRLSDVKALEAINKPAEMVGVEYKKDLQDKILQDLKRIGDNEIYPPYLQIVCSAIFDEIRRSYNDKMAVDSKVYDDLGGVEEIIATHLDEKLFEGLNEEDKYVAENILDALTGRGGLRAFLTMDEISKQIGRDEEKVDDVLEHLIKKRIVHPPGKEDKIKGYELIHDFLSRRFFECLSPEERKIKTVIDIFRRAFRDWKQDGVLVSEDRLEMFFDIRDKLLWGDEECEFVLRSRFITDLYSENKWVTYFNSEIVIRICLDILKGEENAKVMKGAIQTLGDTKNKRVVKPMIKIIEEDKRDDVRETAIDQFWFDLRDARIIDTLLKILKNERNYKLRKSAVYALSKYKERRVVNALVESLHDSRANVRAESAYALGKIHDKSAIEHLIGALETEDTKRTRKNIIAALGKFSDDERVRPLLKSVVENDEEEYEVRQEAKWVLSRLV